MTAMREAVTVYRLPLPDVLFLLNTDDTPVCTTEAVLKREAGPQLRPLACMERGVMHMRQLRLLSSSTACAAALCLLTLPALCCAGEGECVAPIISLSKPLVSHADLLAPVMKAGDARLAHRTAPWADKAAKAFFRHDARCVCWSARAGAAHVRVLRGAFA